MKNNKDILKWIPLIGASATIITFILKIFDKANSANFFTAINFSRLLELLNFITLAIFLFLLADSPTLNIPEENIGEFANIMNIRDEEKDKISQARFNITRVNLLIKQFNLNILCFAFFLSFVYLLAFLDDFKLIDFLGSENTKALGNFFNLISAAFIYFAFKVLYDKTLDDNNHPRRYYFEAIMFIALYYLVYYILKTRLQFSSSSHTENIFRLICGAANGLAMGLLFGRFISMEYFFKDLKFSRNLERSFYHYGSIFLLPLYVLAQPLFGDFDIPEFGEPTILLKNCVYFICLLGKIFFLVLFWQYTKRRWFHLYLHIILAHPITKDIIRLIPEAGRTTHLPGPDVAPAENGLLTITPVPIAPPDNGKGSGSSVILPDNNKQSSFSLNLSINSVNNEPGKVALTLNRNIPQTNIQNSADSKVTVSN